MLYLHWSVALWRIYYLNVIIRPARLTTPHYSLSLSLSRFHNGHMFISFCPISGPDDNVTDCTGWESGLPSPESGVWPAHLYLPCLSAGLTHSLNHSQYEINLVRFCCFLCCRGRCFPRCIGHCWWRCVRYLCFNRCSAVVAPGCHGNPSVTRDAGVLCE